MLSSAQRLDELEDFSQFLDTFRADDARARQAG
jgi:hypothetical protein